ncbi:MAG: FHA domain-containing protein [Muribaculaceae bacterium]|nr:FHA domain-containing protein [Muribaculaceae bacterium]
MKTFTLGRDHQNPISIDNTHSSVSHTHATITIDGDSWTLEDMESTNGTFVEENGLFRRYQRVAVTPDTWIRLGEQGHRGFYFKARRVLHPNDYREDFEKLYEKYQELEEAKKQLESQRRISKFVPPALMLLCYGLSYCIPWIKSSPDLSRLIILAPGLFSPVITDRLLNNLEKRIKKLQEEMICPKCRRPMGKNEIINREHIICKAH